MNTSVMLLNHSDILTNDSNKRGVSTRKEEVTEDWRVKEELSDFRNQLSKYFHSREICLRK